MSTYTDIASPPHTHTHTIHKHADGGEQASFYRREGEWGSVKDVTREISVLQGPEVTLMVSYITTHKAMQEQSCQCMNAALLLSAILIMAPVTALINTITSTLEITQKKKKKKILMPHVCVYRELYTTLGDVGGGGKLCRERDAGCAAGRRAEGL